jgi:phosphoribosylformylglycinamidine (FGAM) synthase-like enzyme/phosphoribosylformylglycinamidine (FGAM) synthase PurS component
MENNAKTSLALSIAFRVTVSTCPSRSDARASGLLHDIAALGIAGVNDIRIDDLYFLAGELDDIALEQICTSLLCDPVVEAYTWQALDDDGNISAAGSAGGIWVVEVALRPGVTDSVAESLVRAAQVAGITGLRQAATGRRYELMGNLEAGQVERIAQSLLANTVIQTYTINAPISPPFVPAQPPDDTVEIIPLREADDAELLAISRARRLSLDLREMRAIAQHFRQEGRDPTDVELETLAQTWSEHCVHKTFKALVDYEEYDSPDAAAPARRRQIDGLLRTTIRAATEKADTSWVRSAFVDNAGIVEFDDAFDLAIKVETHNHPSAIEPFGGANTGVGGVVRDILGVSARPIANTDVLCFGPTDLPFAELPPGVLHPRRVESGVIAGIEDYGNKMGIPTVNGAVLYDPGYTANPLVFCGCVGLLPHGAHCRRARAGDLVVVIGGRTGRDGLRGATFSSDVLAAETGSIAGSAVQIGHPIREKQVQEVVLLARDEGLYDAITDCGAGGLSSAVGEMAEEVGAEVNLERVPLKYPGLRPWEVWLSEAQERMVLAVPPDKWPRLEAICRGLDCEATVIGHFSGDGCVTLRWQGRVVGRLSTAFLHGGLPRRHLRAVWRLGEHHPPSPPPPLPQKGEGDQSPSPRRGEGRVRGELAYPVGQSPEKDVASSLLSLLAHPNVRSKEPIVRRYDHEVQGGTVVKPFVGREADGPGDAAVLCPLDAARRGGRRGAAIGCGICPSYSALDPYRMAWAAVDEAVRNVVAVGADPARIALLDNFCWGDPTQPDRLGGLVRAALGCHDAAVAYGLPFVSGKDSLNNEYVGPDGVRRPIPGTLLITALGLVPDVAQAVTMDLKEAGDLLYILGETRAELGGALYRAPQGQGAENAPAPEPRGPAIARALHQAIRHGLVRACHDCSEGGLGVAAAEMAIAGRLGLHLDLRGLPRSEDVVTDDVTLFGESVSRYLVEVAPEDAAAFEAYFAGLPCARLGQVVETAEMRLTGLAGEEVLRLGVDEMRKAWQEGKP